MPLLSAVLGRRRFLTQLLSAALLPAAGASEWLAATPASGAAPASGPARPAPGSASGPGRRHSTLIGVL